jgi:hypothetical protein
MLISIYKKIYTYPILFLTLEKEIKENYKINCTKQLRCPFVLFPLAIVLSVLLRITDSDYPFGIFKLFLK